jgi:lipoprotein-anchoring transpeptidase ErfK/SrfK
MIGIHGLGNGDPLIHEEFNWTDGCIALTNEEVDELASWIHLGTRVEVQ